MKKIILTSIFVISRRSREICPTFVHKLNGFLTLPRSTCLPRRVLNNAYRNTFKCLMGITAIFISCITSAQNCNFTTYTLSPSGYICSGTQTITLSGSQTGVTYQLAGGGSGGAIGSPVAGTGSALSWTVTQNGGSSYVVWANESGCTNTNVVVGSTYINGIPQLTSNDVAITANYGGILYQNDSVEFTATLSSTGNLQQSLSSFQLFDGDPVGSTTTNNMIAVKSLPVHGSVYSMLVGSAVCGSVMVSCPAIKAAPATPADTLAWLQTAIMQNSSYYIGKPFSVLMDTIQTHGMNMYNMDYLGAVVSDGMPSLTQAFSEDTIRTASFSFFFKPHYLGIYRNQHNHNPDINTNVPYLILHFTQKIPFPSAIAKDIKTGNILGPVLNIVRPYIISSIELDTW